MQTSGPFNLIAGQESAITPPDNQAYSWVAVYNQSSLPLKVSWAGQSDWLQPLLANVYKLPSYNTQVQVIPVTKGLPTLPNGIYCGIVSATFFLGSDPPPQGFPLPLTQFSGGGSEVQCPNSGQGYWPITQQGLIVPGGTGSLQIDNFYWPGGNVGATYTFRVRGYYSNTVYYSTSANINTPTTLQVPLNALIDSLLVLECVYTGGSSIGNTDVTFTDIYAFPQTFSLVAPESGYNFPVDIINDDTYPTLSATIYYPSSGGLLLAAPPNGYVNKLQSIIHCCDRNATPSIFAVTAGAGQAIGYYGVGGNTEITNIPWTDLKYDTTGAVYVGSVAGGPPGVSIFTTVNYKQVPIGS